jgi:hypothetical protein
MSIFKKAVKDVSSEAGTIIGDYASQNVRNATSASIDGMDLFRTKVAQISNVPFAQAKGNLFEYIEAAKFNTNAATANSSARAFVTEALGDPHAKADILIKENGKTVKEIQAKFLKTARDGKDNSAASSVFQQTGANNRGWGEYNGMDRLIRKQEHYNENGTLLDEAKRLSRIRAESDSIYADVYKDVNEHLTDEAKYDSVSSGGTTLEEVERAYNNPFQFSRNFERKAVAAEMKATASNMAKAGFITAGVISGAVNFFEVFKNEKTLSEALHDVGADAIKSGIRGGATGAVSTAIRYHGIKAGSALLSDSMAATVMAGGLIDGGVALFSYAKGEISSVELKEQLVDTTVKATTTVFFTKAVSAILGKAVNPFVPMVVYTAASFIITGTRDIIKNAKLEAEECDRMTALLEEATRVAEENQRQFMLYVEKCEENQRKILNDYLDSFSYNMETGDNYDQALFSISRFADRAGISLQYLDFNDFKDAMNSKESFVLK